jgi:hypothetical protein
MRAYFCGFREFNMDDLRIDSVSKQYCCSYATDIYCYDMIICIINRLRRHGAADVMEGLKWVVKT